MIKQKAISDYFYVSDYVLFYIYAYKLNSECAVDILSLHTYFLYAYVQAPVAERANVLLSPSVTLQLVFLPNACI